MHVLLARRAHHDVGEGKASGKMETKRLAFLDGVGGFRLDRKKVGELTAEEVRGLAFKIVGELARDVGQVPLAIRFPEPAASTVLEFVDEAKSLSRHRIELQALATGRDDGSRSGNAIADQDQRDRFDADGDE